MCVFPTVGRLAGPVASSGYNLLWGIPSIQSVPRRSKALDLKAGKLAALPGRRPIPVIMLWEEINIPCGSNDSGGDVFGTNRDPINLTLDWIYLGRGSIDLSRGWFYWDRELDK